MNKIIGVFNLLLLCSLIACEQSKEADVDLDGVPDILVKNNTAKDYNKQDNIFVFDNVVVNGVTNEQWRAVDSELKLVKKPSFKMSFNTKTQTWDKIPLN